MSVEPTRLASGPLSQRYAGEAEAGKVVADVVQLASPLFYEQAEQKGWFARLDGLPALAGWSPKYWNGLHAAVTISPETLAYNTTLVKPSELPKTWEGVADSRWKGQVLLNDPRNVPSTLAWAYLLRQTYGDDYLRRLAALNPQLVPSAIPGSQQLAAGTAQLLFPAVHGSIVPLLAKKAPIADVVPDPVTGDENFAAVSAKAPHPDGARLLFDFIASPEGQAIFARDGYASVLPGVPGAQPLPPGYQSPNLHDSQAQKAELLKLLGLG